MSDNVAAAVIAGLATGIALIFLVSAYANSSFPATEDEILQKVRSLPEVQALRERYGPLEQIGREGTTYYVYYQIGRTWPGDEGADYDIYKSLHLNVRIDPFGRTEVWFECQGRISGIALATVELVKTTDCIERP